MKHSIERVAVDLMPVAIDHIDFAVGQNRQRPRMVEDDRRRHSRERPPRSRDEHRVAATANDGRDAAVVADPAHPMIERVSDEHRPVECHLDVARRVDLRGRRGSAVAREAGPAGARYGHDRRAVRCDAAHAVAPRIGEVHRAVASDGDAMRFGQRNGRRGPVGTTARRPSPGDDIDRGRTSPDVSQPTHLVRRRDREVQRAIGAERHVCDGGPDENVLDDAGPDLWRQVAAGAEHDGAGRGVVAVLVGELPAPEPVPGGAVMSDDSLLLRPDDRLTTGRPRDAHRWNLSEALARADLHRIRLPDPHRDRLRSLQRTALVVVAVPLDAHTFAGSGNVLFDELTTDLHLDLVAAHVLGPVPTGRLGCTSERQRDRPIAPILRHRGLRQPRPLSGACLCGLAQAAITTRTGRVGAHVAALTEAVLRAIGRPFAPVDVPWSEVLNAHAPELHHPFADRMGCAKLETLREGDVLLTGATTGPGIARGPRGPTVYSVMRR